MQPLILPTLNTLAFYHTHSLTASLFNSFNACTRVCIGYICMYF